MQKKKLREEEKGQVEKDFTAETLQSSEKIMHLPPTNTLLSGFYLFPSLFLYFLIHITKVPLTFLYSQIAP